MAQPFLSLHPSRGKNLGHTFFDFCLGGKIKSVRALEGSADESLISPKRDGAYIGAGAAGKRVAKMAKIFFSARLAEVHTKPPCPLASTDTIPAQKIVLPLGLLPLAI